MPDKKTKPLVIDLQEPIGQPHWLSGLDIKEIKRKERQRRERDEKVRANKNKR